MIDYETWLATEYSGPVTPDQWADWCRANGRPVPAWPDVWTEGTQR
jgi:hypothetical protein